MIVLGHDVADSVFMALGLEKGSLSDVQGTVIYTKKFFD